MTYMFSCSLVVKFAINGDWKANVQGTLAAGEIRRYQKLSEKFCKH